VPGSPGSSGWPRQRSSTAGRSRSPRAASPTACSSGSGTHGAGKGHWDAPGAGKGCLNSPVSVASGGRASIRSNPAVQVSPSLGHPACSAPAFPRLGSVSRSARSQGQALTPPLLQRKHQRPTSPRPLFQCMVLLAIKSLPFLGQSSSLSSSCPASSLVLLGKGLSSTESPSCLGTMGTSRLGPSLWVQPRAGVPGTQAVGLHPAAPAPSTAASARPRALCPPYQPCVQKQVPVPTSSWLAWRVHYSSLVPHQLLITSRHKQKRRSPRKQKESKNVLKLSLTLLAST